MRVDDRPIEDANAFVAPGTIDAIVQDGLPEGVLPPSTTVIVSNRGDVEEGAPSYAMDRYKLLDVNAGTTGAETHLPFGGWKETGNGHREAGHAALDTYTEWKSIYVDFSGRLQRAQIDNR